MPYAPVLFISALTGQRVDKLYELINSRQRPEPHAHHHRHAQHASWPTPRARVQPPTDKGRRLKIYYMTQTGVKPPHFVVFCNDARLFHFSYQRYLENQIRAVYGTPIRLTIRQREEEK